MSSHHKHEDAIRATLLPSSARFAGLRNNPLGLDDPLCVSKPQHQEDSGEWNHPPRFLQQLPNFRVTRDSHPSGWPSERSLFKLEQATRAALQSTIQQLKQAYTFRGNEAIETFISNNRHIVAALEVAPQKIRTQFDAAPLSLSLFSESASIEDATLFIIISTALTPGDAQKRMAILDREWFFDEYSSLRGAINITTEYLKK